MSSQLPFQSQIKEKNHLILTINKPIGALPRRWFDSFEVLVFMMCESGYFSYNGSGIMV